MSKTVYVSIGNSDDKLTQSEWAEFVAEMDQAIFEGAERIHGVWFSRPDANWQNACWCFEPIDELRETLLKARFSTFCDDFQQESIAWAEAETEFICSVDGVRA